MSTAEMNPGSLGGFSPDALDRLKGELAASLEGQPYLFARSAYGVARATPFAIEPLNAIALLLQLDDGPEFTILPTPPEPDGDDLPEPADRELPTPTRVLRVGSGPNFSAEEIAPRQV